MSEEKPKLIIQIPCLNEAGTLHRLLEEIPEKISGVSRIETLVIDDGSTDRTGDIARSKGADHVIRFANTKGLARAFAAGIDASLRLDADIIVNLDGDGQYDPREIAGLIAPILEKKAEMVVGDREVGKLPHFSAGKKALQKAGSWVVRKVSRTDIPDVTSGFRAMSREAALAVNVITDFTYTLETLIQAGKENIPLGHVKVKSRPVRRKSRLFKTLSEYVYKSATTVIRVYTMYKPFKVFTLSASIVLLAGIASAGRFLWFHLAGAGSGHLGYLIAAAFASLLSFQIFLIGLTAELIAVNRKLIENSLRRIKNIELTKNKRPGDTG